MTLKKLKVHYPTQKLDSDKHDIKIEDGVVRIAMDEMAKFDKKPYTDITFARFRIARDIWENMENVDKVEFVDAFEKKVPEEKSEESEVPEEVLTEKEEKSEEVPEEVLTEDVAEKKEE